MSAASVRVSQYCFIKLQDKLKKKSPLHCPLLPGMRSDHRRYSQPPCSAGSWTPCGVWAGSLWSLSPLDHSYCNPMHTPAGQKDKVKNKNRMKFSMKARYFKNNLKRLLPPLTSPSSQQIYLKVKVTMYGNIKLLKMIVLTAYIVCTDNIKAHKE